MPVVSVIAKKVANASVIAGRVGLQKAVVWAEKEDADIGGLQATQIWAVLNDAVIASTWFHFVTHSQARQCSPPTFPIALR